MRAVCVWLLRCVVCAGGVDAAVVKVVLGSVCALLVEAARVDCGAGPLSALLEEAGCSASRVSAFLALYEPLRSLYRSSVSSSLSSFASSSLPSLTSASHRSELYVRSNLAEQIRQPIIFLTLHAQGGGEHRQSTTTRSTTMTASTSTTSSPAPFLSFTATAEDLQDMLAKVREAVRAAAPHAEQQHHS